MTQLVTILGSTGSIGVSTLDVIARHETRYQIFALTAFKNVEVMLSQILAFNPVFAVMVDDTAAAQLTAKLRDVTSSQRPIRTRVLSGTQALRDVASEADVDIVMAAIVGASGLLPTLAAVESGKTILLANKEALVMSGDLFMRSVREHQATLLPIDSEHNAIFQSLPHQLQLAFSKASNASSTVDAGVQKILLTGSGGPFRTLPVNQLASVTPEQAVKHPNWSMGRKISVDSATMMNKGLEFIEACYLFHVTADDIDVVIHPQSVIHSMVQYSDGSVIAQLGQPDMRTPIAHALAFPERITSGVPPLDFSTLSQFTFDKPDPARYPNLYLAQQAFSLGQGATTALNAANEVAVEAFLNGRVLFSQIAEVNDAVLQSMADNGATTLDAILAIDTQARCTAEAFITKQGVS